MNCLILFSIISYRGIYAEMKYPTYEVKGLNVTHATGARKNASLTDCILCRNLFTSKPFLIRITCSLFPNNFFFREAGAKIVHRAKFTTGFCPALGLEEGT